MSKCMSAQSKKCSVAADLLSLQPVWNAFFLNVVYPIFLFLLSLYLFKRRLGIDLNMPQRSVKQTTIHNPMVTIQPCFFFFFFFFGGGGEGRVVRWWWVNFQRRGVLLIFIRVGQGPTAFAVGAGGR